MHHGTFDRNRPVPGAARFSAKSTLRCVRQPTGPFILPKKAAERHRRMKEAEGEADSEPSDETPATPREEPASGAASAVSVSRPEETEEERLERVARERARKRVMKSLGIKPQGEKGKDDPAKHDHLWAFQRFNTTTSQDACTEYQRGFVNDEDMQEEMRHVDATHHLKRNAVRAPAEMPASIVCPADDRNLPEPCVFMWWDCFAVHRVYRGGDAHEGNDGREITRVASGVNEWMFRHGDLNLVVKCFNHPRPPPSSSSLSRRSIPLDSRDWTEGRPGAAAAGGEN